MFQQGFCKLLIFEISTIMVIEIMVETIGTMAAEIEAEGFSGIEIGNSNLEFKQEQIVARATTTSFNIICKQR